MVSVVFLIKQMEDLWYFLLRNGSAVAFLIETWSSCGIFMKKMEDQPTGCTPKRKWEQFLIGPRFWEARRLCGRPWEALRGPGRPRPSALLGPEMIKFCRNFCSCAVDLEMAVVNWKRAVSGPSALLGPEIVKFCRNFCSCAIDLEMAVFRWKRAISGPSSILGPEMVKFCRNFCSCAVDLEMAVFRWKRAVSGPSALSGPEMVKFCRNFCSCAEAELVREKPSVGPKMIRICPGMLRIGPGTIRIGPGCLQKPPKNSRIGLGNAKKNLGISPGDAQSQNWSGSLLARGGVLGLLAGLLEAFWRPPRVLGLARPSGRGPGGLEDPEKATRRPLVLGGLVRAILWGLG